MARVLLAVSILTRMAASFVPRAIVRPARSHGRRYASAAPPPAISLTAAEAELFVSLRSCVAETPLPGTTVRVAGGWVRDKLLGIDGGDIDIALDNMSGVAFAEALSEWSTSKGRDALAVGVVARNPEKSKHLETATTRIGKFSVDFVNLRAEEYADAHSRVPTDVAFGSPLDDALRRDLTVNALFYNVNDGTVEDLTGKGVADLARRVARTPLPPLRTLLDDPLRALRSIRFAARFALTLDAPLREAIQAESVRSALLDKVSRERVGREVELMLGAATPARAADAVRLLRDARLGPMVFHAPGTIFAGTDADADADIADIAPGEPLALDMAEATVHVEACAAALGGRGTAADAALFGAAAAPLSDDHRRLALLAATLWPLRHARGSSLVGGGRGSAPQKRRDAPLPRLVVTEALKLRHKDADAVVVLHACAAALGHLATAGAPHDRAAVGLALRHAAELWRPALAVAAAAGDATVADLGALREAVQGPLGLDGVWRLKPLLDGKKVGGPDALPGLPKGPVMGQVMDAQMRWMLANPKGTAEECAAELRRVWPEYAE